MVTKDQLSVGMRVMARSQFESDVWFHATVADLRSVGIDPLVGLNIHYPNRGGWTIPPDHDTIIRGARHVNDIRLIDEAQDEE